MKNKKKYARCTIHRISGKTRSAEFY